MPNIGLKVSEPLSAAGVDKILTSADTDLAAVINALGNNKNVFLEESITITAAQEITVSGLTFTRNKDAKIIYAGAGALDYFIKISGDSAEMDLYLEHTGTGTVTSGLVINGSDNVLKDASKIEMNNGSGTLTTGVTLEAGSQGNSIYGAVKAVAGTVTDGDGVTDDSANTDNYFVVRSY